MARIIGLKEKQLALADISRKLKQLIPLNYFLQENNPSGLYTISFTKTKPHEETEDAPDVGNKADPRQSKQSAEGKRTIKREKEEKVEAPFLCTDADAVKAYVLAYKAQLVNEIREKAKAYSIEFEEEDEALLR